MKIRLYKTEIMYYYAKSNLQSSVDLHGAWKISFIQLLLVKSQEKDRKGHSYLWSTECDIGSKAELWYLQSCKHKQSFLWRQILNLFHALHFTIDEAIEMKKLAGYYEAPLGKRARARESAVVSLKASLHKGDFTPSLNMELELLLH